MPEAVSFPINIPSGDLTHAGAHLGDVCDRLARTLQGAFPRHEVAPGEEELDAEVGSWERTPTVRQGVRVGVGVEFCWDEERPGEAQVVIGEDTELSDILISLMFPPLIGLGIMVAILFLPAPIHVGVFVGGLAGALVAVVGMVLINPVLHRSVVEENQHLIDEVRKVTRRVCKEHLVEPSAC